jgi:hypothetical protein
MIEFISLTGQCGMVLIVWCGVLADRLSHSAVSHVLPVSDDGGSTAEIVRYVC